MENELINILLKEEEALYRKIVGTPEYNQLLAVQTLIMAKGSQPNHRIMLTETNIYKLDIKVPPITELKEPIVNYPSKYDKYDHQWSWDKKTEYALNYLGKSSPKVIIEYLSKKEGAGGAGKVSGNVYNVLSKNKNKVFFREEAEDGPVYELIKTKITLVM